MGCQKDYLLSRHQITHFLRHPLSLFRLINHRHPTFVFFLVEGPFLNFAEFQKTLFFLGQRFSALEMIFLL